MAKKVERATLCWRCKCATNPPGTNCPWADRGQPVPGWDAELGKVFYMDRGDGTQRKYQSYHVKQCPLYIQDQEFYTRKEVVEEIARTLHISVSSVSSHLRAKIKLYEKTTGRQLPDWVKCYTEESDDEES